MTVNAKGQVTIPEPFRTRYGFRPGAKVAWVERDRGIHPVVLEGLGSLRGRLRGRPGEPSLLATWRAERRWELGREDG